MGSEFEPGECEVLDSILFDVFGDPAPQGSKSGFVGKKGRAKGKVIMVESSKKVKPWRRRIKTDARHFAEDLNWTKHEAGPIRISIQFFMRFPKTPKWKRLGRPDRYPDIDKLARSTLDGLADSGAIYADDKQVIDLHAVKHYVPEGSECGARISITSLRECAKPRQKAK